MSWSRLADTEGVRERERILSTPLSRKPSHCSPRDNSSSDLSLISPPCPVNIKQTPAHHYNLRHPGYTPRWSSTPLLSSDSGSSDIPLETPVKSFSSSPAVFGSGQSDGVKGILDFQKRLDVFDCQAEVDSGFESLIQNEDEERKSLIHNEEEERNVTEKLTEDPAAPAGDLVSRSLGAVARRTSPRNKLKPSTDRLPSKSSSRTKRSKSSSTLSRQTNSREGHEVCDFIRHLGGFEVALGILFSYLSGKDLCRVVQVSTTWRLALQKFSKHEERRLAFISNMKIERENLGKENFFSRRISPRRAMVNISNWTSPTSAKRDRNHSASIIVSPSKVRHMLFREEGKKLCEGERQIPCPTCSSPSRVSPITASSGPNPGGNRQTERASCSSSQCKLVFCPECKCPDHPDRPCRTTRGSYKLSKSGGVTSQKSKNRLRRL